MRWGLVAIACGVLGCSDARGVDLEITADVDIDTVELFVVAQRCADCDMRGIAWQPDPPRAAGEVFTLTSDERVIETARVVDGRHVLRLQAEPGYQQPQAIAVVGYRDHRVVAAKILWNVRIPLHSTAIWRIQLDRTDPATTDLNAPPAQTAPTHRALVWPRRASAGLPDAGVHTGCLVYQDWLDHEQRWKNIYFVPESDPDCDGHAVECDPHWLDYNSGGDINPCVTATGPQLLGTCTLGSADCADGVTTQTSCRQLDDLVCLPDRYCVDCAADPSLAACMATTLAAHSYNSGLIDCAWHPDRLTGTVCPNGAVAKLVLPTTCTAVGLRSKTDLLGSASSTVGVGASTIAVTFTQNQQNCAIDLVWSSGTQQVEAADRFLLEIDVPNGHRVLLPIQLRFENGAVCGTTAGGACSRTNAPDMVQRCLGS